jgi:hypothetical protein
MEKYSKIWGMFDPRQPDTAGVNSAQASSALRRIWKYKSRGIFGFVFLASVLISLAWSSKDFPPCEEIHQMAIENVLSNQVSPDLIKILQNEQAIVDLDQQASNSFEHSMTGIEDAQQNITNETPIYILKSEAFIHSNLVAAISAREAGNIAEAYTNLGKAIHPLEDATSPAHEPFQAWKYNESLWAEIVHVSKEYSYPDNPNDTNQVEEKAELEGSVQYAYDIFMGKTNMPVNFYDHTTGLLDLPSIYVRKGTP